jgi:hypothetical protein
MYGVLLKVERENPGNVTFDSMIALVNDKVLQ